MARVPATFRAPQARTGNLRPALWNAVQTRARLHPLPNAASRPQTTRSTDRDRAEPSGAHHRSPHERLARRSPRTPDQPASRSRQARQSRTLAQEHTHGHHRPRDASPPWTNTVNKINLLVRKKEKIPKEFDARITMIGN